MAEALHCLGVSNVIQRVRAQDIHHKKLILCNYKASREKRKKKKIT